MKPPPFEYLAPSTLEEALILLRDSGPDAKPLAGGQSLVPMMNFRLARPSHLVDLNRIAALSYIRVENDELRIGAMATLRSLERGLHLDLDRLGRLALGPATLGEARELLARFQRFHLGLELRSQRFLDGILAGSPPPAA